jgi:alpha-galactosidase
MVKITIVGAGSHVFARRLVGDILTWPSLSGATITLMDVNPDALELMAALARRMVKELKVEAKIEATTDLRAAVEGANYVITAIRVGTSRAFVDVPMKYGIDQAVGDTAGPGGVFYFLRNAPAMVKIAQTMEELCPDALLLNYTNPMVMLCWAIHKLTKTKTVGLCHSVQGTAMHLAEYIGAPFEEVSYWVAGINHMAWFLRFAWNKKDAYPLLWQAMEKPEIYQRDIVKWEIMRYFGAFVTESSIHNSEYMPYFRRSPEMIARYTSETMWGVARKGQTRAERMAEQAKRRKEQEEENRRAAYDDAPLVVERTHEFCTFILNALETNVPYVFNGNVPNTGLITNLVPDSIVEVPIMTDACGLHPCYVGDLPAQLAGLNRGSHNLQELAVKGFVEKDRESIYRAVQLDPLTAAKLTLPEIRKMVDEMFAADKEYITF